MSVTIDTGKTVMQKRVRVARGAGYHSISVGELRLAATSPVSDG
jgi:hypothetical protein